MSKNEYTCPICDGKRFIPRVADYQDRSDEEPCWLCNPPRHEDYSDLADVYDSLVAMGHGRHIAAEWVDGMMIYYR